MYRPPVPLVDPPTDLTPEQKLAAAVLRQAVTDARSYQVKRARPLIRGWLTSTTNDECRWWCSIAGLDHDRFVRHVRKVLRTTTPI